MDEGAGQAVGGAGRRRGRWGAIAGLWAVQSALAYVLVPVFFGAPKWDEIGRILTEPGYLAWFAGAAGVIFVLQLVFLWPVRRPMDLGTRRALAWSAGVGGLASAVLATGAIASVIDAVWLATDRVDLDRVGWVPFAVLGAVSWMVFSLLILRFVRRGRAESALSRIAARLFLGTVVEVLAVVPLHAMVRKKTDCYCATGTFLAMIGAVGVGWLVFGPMVLLPIVAKRRRRWYAGHCDSCGYDMSGCLSAERCPECGAGWKAAGG